MNTETLSTFINLSNTKSFTTTAELMYISQSTVTKRIAELEKEINSKLFSRDNKHVILTAEGIIFLNYAKRILDLKDESIKEITSSPIYDNHLRIGTTNALYECFLFDKILNFNKSDANSVKIIIDHSSDLITALQDGIIDIAFTYTPFQKKGYLCNLYEKDHLVLVTAYENTEYSKGIKKEDLPDLPYLMCNFTLQEAGIFIREFFPPHYQFKFEIDNSTKLIPYLLKEKSYSFIPQKMAEEYVKQKKFRIIPLLDFETPEIHSYYIGNLLSENRWKTLINCLTK